MPDLEVRPYSTAVGAEVLGVDLSQPLDAATLAAIQTAFQDHLVLFFRDQTLTPEQQIAFSRHFGELEDYPYVEGIDGYPELIEIVKTPDEVRNFGHDWHADMTFRENPPLGAVLYAIEIPPVGGDTLFANMYLAWETLSDGMKAMLSQVRGLHDSSDPSSHSQNFAGMAMREKTDGKRQVTAHPFSKVHPVTGRTSLMISPSYCFEIEGMTPGESRMILEHLRAHATQDIFCCRFRWEPGSVVVWDNRCLMHQALEDDLGAMFGGQGFRRVMRRATISA
jgi:taurine dioxygenase